MSASNLPPHIQRQEINNKLERVRIDLLILNDLLRDLYEEKENHRMNISKVWCDFNRAQLDNLVYQHLQKQNQKLKDQYGATVEILEDTEKLKKLLLEQQEELKNNLSQLL